MKKIRQLLFISLFATSMSIFAESSPNAVQLVTDYPSLNLISFAVSAEKWVKTDTAKVVVGVDANLKQDGLEKLQGDFMQRLKQFSSNASWRITRYDRSQDRSELERVHMEAEARLPESELSGLRAQAKKMSSPGMKYSIINIEYKPSLADVEAVREAVRAEIYQKIAAEIAQLNKTYPGQNYFVHSVYFIGDGVGPTPAPRAQEMMSSAKVMRAVTLPAMTVSDKVMLQARVYVAARVN